MAQLPIHDIRNTAELLWNNGQMRRPPHPRMNRGTSLSELYHSVDMYGPHALNYGRSEQFLGGYMADGRMSVVRRFFCLFVTFDLFFVALLWLICIMLNGDNIFQAFRQQILNYSIYTSLFDVVVLAICRFILLLLFYAVLYVHHWFIIAFSTSGSCLFLIVKVFTFDWIDSHQQIFQVILIITSFVIAWGEAWFLDCRVLPQESYARYFPILSSPEQLPISVPPFLVAEQEGPSNFYSPLDSAPHSDDEDAEENEEYHQMGLHCVRKAYDLLQSSDWKVEKVTDKGDTIRTLHRENIGKIYRMTGRINYPAELLLNELFYRIEDVPKWNPSLLESSILKKINSYTDITYQVSAGGGGGLVKSRDFINLRCWRLFQSGQLCSEDEAHRFTDSEVDSVANRFSIDDTASMYDATSYVSLPEVSSAPNDHITSKEIDIKEEESNLIKSSAFETLSKSLGARGFSDITVINDDWVESRYETQLNANIIKEDAAPDTIICDTRNEDQNITIAQTGIPKTDKMWINAAVSIEYAKCPPVLKYTRGENLVAAFAMHEIAGKMDACIFEWIICIDLKGYVPRYVQDNVYTVFMTDYMKHLRLYVKELSDRRKRNSRRR